MITLHTLGEARIDVGGETLRPSAGRTFAALLYLASHAGTPVRRDSLAGLLWDRRTPTRHALRQLLYRLRRLGVPLDAGEDVLCLPASHLAGTLSSGPTAARVREALGTAAWRVGPWLGGEPPAPTPAYAAWADAERARIEGALRGALRTVLAERRAVHAWNDVGALGEALRGLDPLSLEAHLALAERACAVGAPADARALLDRYSSEAAPLPPQARAAVARARAAAAREPLVGRASLVATLGTLLDRAAAGRGAAVALVGPDGMGRSRLLEESERLARERGFLVAVHRADAGEPPWRTIARLSVALSDAPGALGCAPASLAQLRRLTNAAAEGPSEDARAAPMLAARLRGAFVELVESVAHEQPVVLLVDDLHRCDAHARATLAQLAARCPAHAVLLLATSDGAAPLPDGVAAVAVPRLDDASAATLVQRVAPTLGVDAVEWCVEAGGGHPGLLRELAWHRARHPAIDGPPPSLGALLMRRLDVLPSVARRALQVVALLGEAATVRRVAEVLALPPHALLDAFDALERAAAIETRDDETLRATPDALGALALASLGATARAALHWRAAAALAEEGDGADVPHWLAAGEPARAAASARRAARTLLERGASEEAARLLEGVGDASPAADPSLLAEAARAWSLTGRWARAHALLERAGPDADPPLAIEARWRLGLADAEALRQAARSLATTHRDVAGRLRAVVLAVAFTEAAGSNDPLSELGVLLDAMPADGPWRRDVLRARMAYHVSFGQLSSGQAAADALALGLGAGPTEPGDVGLLLDLSDALEVLGRTADARAAATRAHAAARAYGAPALAARAAARLAAGALGAGALDDAARWSAEAHALVPPDDVATHAELADLTRRLRIATEPSRRATADASRAWRAVERGGEGMPTSARLRRALATTAAEAYLAIGRPLPAALLSALRATHCALAYRTGHDRTAAALTAALAAQAPDDAAALAADYVSVRRSLAAPPQVLRDAVRRR